MSPTFTQNEPPNDLVWDAFVASLHRVWEFAPDFAPIAATNLNGKVVVIVDHEVQHRSRLAQQLTNLGMKVHAAAGFAEGTSQIRSIAEQDGKVDLVIVGIKPNDESALQFCSDVADGEWTMTTPMIVLFEEAPTELIRHARLAGARFVLRKPYDPYVMLTLISSSLDPS